MNLTLQQISFLDFQSKKKQTTTQNKLIARIQLVFFLFHGSLDNKQIHDSQLQDDVETKKSEIYFYYYMHLLERDGFIGEMAFIFRARFSIKWQ